MAERKGKENVLVKNGAVKEIITLDIIDLPDRRDIFVELPDFRLFWYRIEGFPAKPLSNINVTTEVPW